MMPSNTDILLVRHC